MLAELLPLLRHLDRRLDTARGRATELHGADAADDPYRGLYIEEGEVERLLRRAPGRPDLAPDRTSRTASREVRNAPGERGTPGSRLAWLTSACELSPFDLDVLVLALAPELDRRYERVYAFLQDHVGRRWPTVDLALHLFCADAGDRLAQRRRFAADAPLLRSGLVRLVPDHDRPPAPLLAHAVVIDELVVRFLLHEEGVDRRVASCCRSVPPDELSASVDAPGLDEGVAGILTELMAEPPAAGGSLRVYLEGPDPTAKRLAVRAAASASGLPVVEVDVPAALADAGGPDAPWSLLARTAWLSGAVSYWNGVDPTQPATLAALLGALAATPGPAVLAGAPPWAVPPDTAPGLREASDVLAVTVAAPGFAERRACWQRHLSVAGPATAAEDLDALADRFRLTREDIAAAVAAARRPTSVDLPADPDRGDPETGRPAGVAALFTAARARSARRLAPLARRIEPRVTWRDIVLPAETLAQLQAICARVEQRPRVLGAWGFDRKLSRGKGVTALFAGPSGAGKTMAAEVVARELGLDLYQIDLSGVVSKYIGETEKNLDQVFAAAETGNAVLLFDEADALFGKRSAVSDAHDRYANIEISYLLQRMETYDGIAVLATNLRQNLDDAFLRRLAFAAHFPFPDVDGRRRIWAAIWPAATPLDPDVDVGELAERYKLSGGSIKNVALAAAFLAARDGTPVTMAHLHRAADSEFEKLGKLPPAGGTAPAPEGTGR